MAKHARLQNPAKHTTDVILHIYVAIFADETVLSLARFVIPVQTSGEIHDDTILVASIVVRLSRIPEVKVHVVFY